MVWEGNLDMSHNDTATGAIVNIYIHSSMCKIQTCVHTIQQGLSWNDDPHTERKKRKKNYACTLYRHECEPVIQMLNTADHVVA